MAESVKEVVPETRPRGPRRGLDRLRASGDGQTAHVSSASGSASAAVPAGTAVRDASPPLSAQAAAPASDLSTPPIQTPAVPAPAAIVPTAEADSGAPTPAAAPAATKDGPPASTGRRIKRGHVLVAVIAVLALLVGWLAYRFWDTHSSAQADKRQYEQLNATDARDQAVLSAARQAAVTLLTYDYRHLDKDFAAVLNGSTGGFKKDFASKQSTAKTLFTQGKAVASGQVLDAAVASSTPTSATVLAVLDQSVKNVSVPDGTVKHYRMQLKLTKVGSAWLVSDVEFPA
jgi:Mce-associated membrane protein